MKKIAVINSKGGVGKTTFVDELAFELNERGYAVEVADLDEQQGSQFHNAIPVPDNPDVVIFDTRGTRDPGVETGEGEVSITAIIEDSDLVIIPVTMDEDSLDPLAKTVAKCQKAGVDYRIYENRVRMSTNLHQDIDADIRDAHPGRVSKIRVPEGVVVGTARRFNIGWRDVDKRAKPVVAFESIVDEVIERVGL